MTKPYTYEEIESFLKKELSKTKHIMTFGRFGSTNIENDLDALITKKPKSKTSEFYKEVHNIFDKLNSYLRKCDGRLIRVSRANHEEEVKYISRYNPKTDLVIQATTYVSLPQIKKAWALDIGSWKNLDSEVSKILQNQKFLRGNADLLFSKEFNKEVKYENVYGALDIFDRINSNLPEVFLVHKMNHFYDYILRKLLKTKPLVAKNEKEVREIFYKICEKIEK